MSINSNTHLDFTTLYGAASMFKNDSGVVDVTLRRLLCLSQFIESIVLHDLITYEVGTSKEWEKYTEALLASPLITNAKKHGLPVRPLGQQFDNDESALIKAIRNVVEYIESIPLAPLFWALQFRKGTFSAISTIQDNNNPVIKKYIDVANSIEDLSFKNKFQNGISKLKRNEIGSTGFAVLVRLELLQNSLVSEGKSNYYPHYARQPIIANLNANEQSVIPWSMQSLNKLREKAIEGINSPEDTLAKSLSPIFIACLDNAKYPDDIIENAMKIRVSKEAKGYRNEVRKAISSSFDQVEYKINLDRIMSLEKLLNANKPKVEYLRQWNISLKAIPLGYTCAGKRTLPRTDRVGDRTAIFFSDILRQSLAFVDSSQKLSEIFRANFKFDTSIISCAIPK